MAAAVVADGRADILGDGIESFQQVVDRLGLERGLAFQGFVQIRNVGAVMFVVMDLHRSGVDVGFQCVKRIRKRGHAKCHGFFLQSEI